MKECMKFGGQLLALLQEPFTANFCRYPVLAEVALTYRCNLTCVTCIRHSWDEPLGDEEIVRRLKAMDVK